MKVAIYPGSFDPITNGHLDIINRVSHIVDKLIVGVLDNQSKTPLFTAQERVSQIQTIIRNSGYENIEVVAFSGLLVEFAKMYNAKIIIKGLRAISDFENEFQMALINKSMDQELETLFIPTSTQYLYLSSSVVKEIAKLGGNVDDMVPLEIKQILLEKF